MRARKNKGKNLCSLRFLCVSRFVFDFGFHSRSFAANAIAFAG